MSENSSSTPVLPRRIGYAVFAIVWVIAAYVVATIAMVILLRSLVAIGVPLASLSNNVVAFVSAALVWAIMLPTLLVPLKRWGILKNLKQQLGIERLLSWSDIGLALVAFVPYLILSSLLGGLANAFWPGFNSEQAQNVGFSQLTNQPELVLAFIALVIAAPIIEEVIFRGFLFARLKKHVGVIAGILLTSLTFAVLHAQLNVGIDVFALSLVLCGLRLTTGSIWAGIILHMTKNALAFSLLFVVPML